MSNNSWFDKFPLMTYRGANCVNITEKVDIFKSIGTNPYIYYPYDLQNYERADQFAYRYYNDPFLSWLFYLTNGIKDPLREWYLQIDEVNELITLKYGSVQLAMQKTKFYRNNWVAVNNILPDYYEALPVVLQEYWQPVFTGHKITSYERIPIDWALGTNRIVEYKLANTAFQYDEVVNIVWNDYANGQGQVLSINANNVFLQHVNGYFQESLANPITSRSFIYGQESHTNAAFSMTSGGYAGTKIVADNLTPEEEIYWIPVTYYNYENELNEMNKTIRVLDRTYANPVIADLITLMDQNVNR